MGAPCGEERKKTARKQGQKQNNVWKERMRAGKRGRKNEGVRERGREVGVLRKDLFFSALHV